MLKKIQERRPTRCHKAILQHDKAHPHTANITKSAVQELGWEIIPHPSYSPDLAPPEFHRLLSKLTW